MAKISARGATKVETIKSPALGYTHTLCSDGRILRKSELQGYHVVARIKPHVTDPLATFRAYVKRFEAARS